MIYFTYNLRLFLITKISCQKQFNYTLLNINYILHHINIYIEQTLYNTNSINNDMKTTSSI